MAPDVGVALATVSTLSCLDASQPPAAVRLRSVAVSAPVSLSSGGPRAGPGLDALPPECTQDDQNAHAPPQTPVRTEESVQNPTFFIIFAPLSVLLRPPFFDVFISQLHLITKLPVPSPVPCLFNVNCFCTPLPTHALFEPTNNATLIGDRSRTTLFNVNPCLTHSSRCGCVCGGCK